MRFQEPTHPLAARLRIAPGPLTDPIHGKEVEDMSRRARALLLAIFATVATTTLMWLATAAQAGIQGTGLPK